MRTSNAVVSLCGQRYWKVKNDSQEGILYEARRKNVERVSVEVQNRISTLSVQHQSPNYPTWYPKEGM